VQSCIGVACVLLLLLLPLVQQLGFEVLWLLQKLRLKMALQLLLCMQSITSIGTVLTSVITASWLYRKSNTGGQCLMKCACRCSASYA